MILPLPYGTFEIPDVDVAILPELLNTGFWDYALRPYFDRVPPGATVIDVGAHVGLYSGYLAARGARLVIAFEAHPLYAPLLKANIDRNQWGMVIMPYENYLYSRPCRLGQRVEHPTPASNTWLPLAEEEPGGKAATVLDYWLRNYTGDRIFLLKVDAQGADLHVLLGAEQLIQRDHPMILIEYESPLAALHGHSADDYRQWIAEHDYVEDSINGWNACLTWKGGR